MILEHGSDCEHFTIEHNKFFIVKNVRKYEHCRKNYNKISLDLWQPSEVQESEHVYFLIDSPSNMAFGHWVFESAIFLRYWKTLKEMYPSIKIHFLVKKEYKLLFLRHYGIEELAEYELKENNICIIPSPVTSVHLSEHFDIFQKNIAGLYQEFDHYGFSKIIPILIMPRQKKENYPGNDRNYDKQFERIIEANKDTPVFHTDTVIELVKQIETVRSAKKIYISDGSAFLVNGFFAKDSDIHIVDNVTKHQAARFKRYAFIIDYIKRNNRIYY